MSIALLEEKHVSKDSRLHTLDLPKGIQGLDENSLISLAAQVRKLIPDVGPLNGGHLASPYGTVDFAVALLPVFDIERDRIIWEVGHQSHGYEILRGCRDRYDTTRKKLDLSGYSKRSESFYDSFPDHASRSDPLEECGLDAEHLAGVAPKLPYRVGRSRTSRDSVTAMNQ